MLLCHLYRNQEIYTTNDVLFLKKCHNSKFVLIQQNYELQIIWTLNLIGTTKLGPIGPEKMLGPKNFVTKYFGPKKCLVKNWSKNNVIPIFFGT